ncbi:MAG: ABC transporter permease [Methylotenera sp.]|nr:ABC transporter permease [Methylotenera sp.]
MMNTIWIIGHKELIEAYRDMRSLLIITVVSVLAGPLLLLMLANSLASFEARAERNIVMVKGIEHAPSLANYFARDTALVITAPSDSVAALERNALLDPVLIIPEGFDAKLNNEEAVELQILTNSANARVNAGVARLKRKLSGYIAEKNNHHLVQYGVSFKSPLNLRIQDYDIANRQADAAKVFGMLPYFLVLAALYGVWAVSLDITVGERERGTLAPLMLAVKNSWSIVIGKWLAATVIGALIVLVAVIAFIPAQVMMSGETLKSMFAFGVHEATTCILLLMPLVGLFSAALIWVGVRSNTTKQAQALATAVLLMITLTPLTMQIAESGQQTLQHMIPVIAQHMHIMAMIKGEAIQLSDYILTGMSSIGCAFIFMYYAQRQLKLSDKHGS